MFQHLMYSTIALIMCLRIEGFVSIAFEQRSSETENFAHRKTKEEEN